MCAGLLASALSGLGILVDTWRPTVETLTGPRRSRLGMNRQPKRSSRSQ